MECERAVINGAGAGLGLHTRELLLGKYSCFGIEFLGAVAPSANKAVVMRIFIPDIC